MKRWIDPTTGLLARIVLWLAAVVGGAQHADARAETLERSQPNILFIAVDDLRPELGCYSASHIHSPSIDRLAGEGLVFERAYTPMAICMPARASLMSGLRPMNGRMYRRGPMREYAPDVLSLNEHFQNSGYETVNIGKIYHHASDEESGWTRNFRNIEGPWGKRGYVERASLELESRREETGKRGPALERADVDDAGYQTGAFADKAIEELQGIGDKPLFLALGFRKPHLPFNAPKKYWDLYDAEDIELPSMPSPPADAAPEGLSNWGELRHYAGIPDEGPVPPKQARTLIHGYYACVSYVDAQIGRVLDEVDRLGLRENTIVVLWSDHGWKLGDYGMWCKHTNHEIDTRIPMIVRAPGMKEVGGRTFGYVELFDIYPTLCDLAGLERPEHLDGTSFAPLLDDTDRGWKDAAFSIWASPTADRANGVLGYSVRQGHYRYTEWRERHGGALVSRELYDHRDGSLADENLANDVEHAARVTSLAEQLRIGHREAWLSE